MYSFGKVLSELINLDLTFNNDWNCVIKNLQEIDPEIRWSASQLLTCLNGFEN